MLKVLLYIPRIDAKSGGLGSFISLLSRDLGVLCSLHIVSHHFEDELPLESCTIHYIPHNLLKLSHIKKQYITILQELKPDVCHINGCWDPLCSLIAIWTKGEGRKIVYSPHGMLEPYAVKRHFLTRKLPAIFLYQRRSIAKSDIIHATSQIECDNLLHLRWNNRITIVPNCIQIEKADIKESWKKTQTILFLSRIHPKKGIHYLIESIAKLKAKLTGYRCLVVGPEEGNYKQQLIELVGKLDVADIVEFREPVYDLSKWELYRQADVFVLPTESENFGIVIAEALACGTPVITTVGTPWSELNTHNCGWWTGIGTVPTTKALEEFLECDDVQLETMGRNGRKLVEEKYTSEVIAKQFLELYLRDM